MIAAWRLLCCLWFPSFDCMYSQWSNKSETSCMANVRVKKKTMQYWLTPHGGSILSSIKHQFVTGEKCHDLGLFGFHQSWANNTSGVCACVCVCTKVLFYPVFILSRLRVSVLCYSLYMNWVRVLNVWYSLSVFYQQIMYHQTLCRSLLNCN